MAYFKRAEFWHRTGSELFGIANRLSYRVKKASVIWRTVAPRALATSPMMLACSPVRRNRPEPNGLYPTTATPCSSHQSRTWRSIVDPSLIPQFRPARIGRFWIKEASLTDTDSLPPPDVIAAEIADDPETALERFTKIAERLAQCPACPVSRCPNI